ncbi:cytochrome d ubiquinol oxidase subunit I [Catenulispora sp. MAP12-49]|uniref:cytochrome ubiquinol oxidase subunit I n=1 Tax=Catenulispora sp. MAP12-49 TaxID=3156302 RepID=UPI003516DA48
MNTLMLARWQFGITTVYHFFFVPLTIGLSALVAILQTAWLRTGKEQYLRAVKFWGKLFLINFALGVATGIVQEFQFGMDWSAYSRFVGDIFGAPLAIEGLLAFFMESTFLGLWIFGWGRLPARIHLACIWLVSIGTMLSAYFILAANAWMQHPVGYRIDAASNRAVLTDFFAVLTNSTAVIAFFHTLTAAFLYAGMLLVGVSAWHLGRRRFTEVFRPSMRLGLWAALVATAGLLVTGDIDGKIMTEQQPMKMAAAEALYHTSKPASFSLFTIGSLNGGKEVFSVRVPGVLSFLATGSFNGKVDGINDVQALEASQYGPGSYKPVIPVTYWSFRLMIGFGLLAALVAVVGLWWTRRGRMPERRWFWRVCTWSIALPILASSFGWIFTEMGRQPWAVYGVLTTRAGVSLVSAGEVLTSLIVLTALYGVLAVVEVGLMVRYAKADPPEIGPAADAGTGEDEQRLSFAY